MIVARRFPQLLAASLVAAWVAAFSSVPALGDENPPVSPLPAEGSDGSAHTVGYSLGGRAIECQEFGVGSDVLMVIATIHGNEASGTPLVAAFADWLRANPDELAGKKVVIVPVANPDGFAADERFNQNGVDLNRNFPATNFGGDDTKPYGERPLSEPESRTLMKVLCHYFPARVVSIHQPVNCVDYDGPAESLAQAMAAECPLPVKKLGSRPGSLGSFVGVTLNRPIITLELPKNAGMDAQQLWQVYGGALRAALRHSGQ
ncbi:MAG: DUF2817 domain-containing protein [Planctomycetota bacterium]